jgi:hypothetical protein
VLVAVSAKNKRFLLNRVGTSTVTESKVLGGATKAIRFEPNQIASVLFETHTQYSHDSSSSTGINSGSRRERVSTLAIVLKDTSEILLASANSGQSGVSIGGVNLSSFGKAPLADEATQVATFFNVPLLTSRQGEAVIEPSNDIAHH